MSKPEKDSPEVLALIERGLPLVDSVAKYMRRRTGGYAAHEDLIGSGREALLQAARAYDPDRGVVFEGYASLRIRGAMLDTIRQMSDLPKRVYGQVRALRAAQSVDEVLVEEQAAAGPTMSPEAADAKLGERLSTSAMAMALSILRPVRGGRAVLEIKSEESSPESQANLSSLMNRVNLILAERTPEERLVIQRFYFEEVSLEDIGKELGVSRSWASRLHTRAIEALIRAVKEPG